MTLARSFSYEHAPLLGHTKVKRKEGERGKEEAGKFKEARANRGKGGDDPVELTPVIFAKTPSEYTKNKSGGKR